VVPEPIIALASTDCQNIVYSNGQLVCADTGEVLDDHPVALDIQHNTSLRELSENDNRGASLVMVPRRVWIQVVEMYKQGATIREIMSATGIRSVDLIYRILRASTRLRKKHRPHRRVTLDEARKICEMWCRGMPKIRIAEALGRPISTVIYVIRRHCRACTDRGSDASAGSSSSDDPVRKLERAGVPHAELVYRVLIGELTTWSAANILGISPKTVYYWVRKAREVLGE